MAETKRPELLRYAKTHIAVEIPHKFASPEERDRFLEDLVATYDKHGIGAEKGTFRTGPDGDEVEGLMMKLPYGIADF